MTVDTVYKIMQFAVNKNQNGYLTPDQFNLIINQAQNSYMAWLLGETQQFQYQVGQPRVQYSISENTRQKIQPFINTVTLSVSSGFSAYPIDYQVTDTMTNSNGIDRIRYAANNKLFSFLKSKIDPVATNPVYSLGKTGFNFYPSTLSSAILSYISVPTQIVWAYTLDVNGRPVYNPATPPSVNPKWYDSDMLEIIVRALRLVGVNLKDGEVSQYANEIKNGGQ
jgi:hypothetical protein